MTSILKTTAVALVGLAVLAASPAMAGKKGKSHKFHKGGITINLGKAHWYKHYNPYWYEPECYYKKVVVFSHKHGHPIKKTVLVCD